VLEPSSVEILTLVRVIPKTARRTRAQEKLRVKFQENVCLFLSGQAFIATRSFIQMSVVCGLYTERWSYAMGWWMVT